jgi:hypothetical protein
MRTIDGQGKNHRACDLRLPGTMREPQLWENNVDPLTMAPRWALCPLDWHAHAVDAWADHPPGVCIIRCGHQLSGSTPLYDVPQGWQCERCARWSPVTEPSGQSSGRQT